MFMRVGTDPAPPPRFLSTFFAKKILTSGKKCVDLSSEVVMIKA